ncbi:MAG TPA: SRPBCC family protein [Steroidobacteraceae bacterium]|nr:SRPBCC family protein [Steroidobacteraceae bacterium]
MPKTSSNSPRSVVHATFCIERTYPVSPAQVFEALTDPAAKAKWFTGGDGYTVLAREMDVRPGGREHLKGRWATGVEVTFDAVYHDVVADERIVYSYEMHLDDRKISVSLATLELKALGSETRLVMTEQGAFLDGYDDAGSRERGSNSLLDALGSSLK